MAHLPNFYDSVSPLFATFFSFFDFTLSKSLLKRDSRGTALARLLMILYFPRLILLIFEVLASPCVAVGAWVIVYFEPAYDLRPVDG